MGLDVLLDHDESCGREGCPHVAQIRSDYGPMGYNRMILALIGHGDLYEIFGYDLTLSVADPTRSVRTQLFKSCRDSGVPLWRPSDAHLHEALTRAEEVLREIRSIDDPVAVISSQVPWGRKIGLRDALNLARRYRRRAGWVSRALEALAASGRISLLYKDQIVAVMAGLNEDGPLVHVFHRLPADDLEGFAEIASEVVSFIKTTLLIPEEERNIWWYW